MKKYLMTGIAALTLCAGFTSCSHDFEPMTQAEIDKAKYDQAFLKYVGGKIAADQDWGFGTTTSLTRAVFSETWSGVHADCKFDDSVFEMAVPSGAVDLTKGNFTDAEKKATVFYITGNGDFNFNYAFNIPAGAKIYVSGTVTSLNGVNYDGVVTFYNTGNLTFTGANGARHTVINTGTLTVTDYANIGDLYNKGALVLERGHSQWWANEGGSADIPDAMHIYSNSEATIEMPDGGDLKAICDIHGTLTVGDGKYLKIQNSTRKYICGIISTSTVENTDGPLETSYVKAEVFKFDGNPIYLLPGGHVDVTTLQVPNSNCHFYGAANSTGLVEAVNYEFGNKNDFTHTFSNNIYFKSKGGYVKVDNCYAMGQSHYFNTVADYLADTTHADEFALAANRINAGDATGVPACGQPWTVGTPKQDEFTFLCRVFAEDLSASESTDFDFNDVVFDVYTNKQNQAKVEILAAGGTLPLYVADQEVHGLFGNYPTDVMINTNAKGGEDGVASVELPFLIEGVSGLPDVNEKIVVKVWKSDEPQVLTAMPGKPAAKFAVTEKIQWVKERKDFSEDYPNFKSWAKEGTPTVWWK